MAVTNHDINYNVTTKAKVDPNISKLFETVSKMSDSMANLNKQRVNPSISPNIQKNIQNINKSVVESNSLFKTLTATVLGFFAIDRAADFGKSIVETGSKYEMLEIQLTNLTKSASDGSAIFKQMQEDAKTTPFGVEQLTAANAGLISAGLNAKEARLDILALGNAVAYSGKGNEEFVRMSQNLQQIKNVGKATAMDIKQFGIAGINIYGALAKATGLPIDKVKEMDISYELLSKSLRMAMGEGGVFEGGLSSLANSTEIAMSNLNDLFDEFKNGVFQDLKPAITELIKLSSDMIEKMKGLIDWVKQNKVEILTFGVAITTLVTAWQLYTLWTNRAAIANALNTISIFASLVATDGLALSLYAAGIAGQVAWAAITLGLTAVIAGIVYAYNKSGEFRAVLAGIGNTILEVGALIGNTFVAAFEWIQSGYNEYIQPLIDKWDNFKAGIGGGIKESMGGVWEWIADKYNEYIQPYIDAFKEFFSTITDFFKLSYRTGYQNKKSSDYDEAKKEAEAKKAEEAKKKATEESLKTVYGNTKTTSSATATGNKTLPGVIKSSVSDGVDSKRAKNIYITFDSMLKVLGNQILQSDKQGRDIIDNLNLGFSQILNNANLLAE